MNISADIETNKLHLDALKSKGNEETSAQIRARVDKAREIQNARYKGTGITCNARLTPAMLEKFCVLSPDAENALKTVFDKMNNKNDPRAKLLLALKPYLKESRKEKVEQYIQLFNMSSMLEGFNFMGGDKIK